MQNLHFTHWCTHIYGHMARTYISTITCTHTYSTIGAHTKNFCTCTRARAHTHITLAYVTRLTHRTTYTYRKHNVHTQHNTHRAQRARRTQHTSHTWTTIGGHTHSTPTHTCLQHTHTLSTYPLVHIHKHLLPTHAHTNEHTNLSTNNTHTRNQSIIFSQHMIGKFIVYKCLLNIVLQCYLQFTQNRIEILMKINIIYYYILN